MGYVGLSVSCNENSPFQPLDVQSTAIGRKTNQIKVCVIDTSYSRITTLTSQLLPLCPPQNTGGEDTTTIIMLHFWKGFYERLGPASCWVLWLDPEEHNTAI